MTFKLYIDGKLRETATVKLPVRQASEDDNWFFHATGHCQNRLAFCPECARAAMQAAGVKVEQP